MTPLEAMGQQVVWKNINMIVLLTNSCIFIPIMHVTIVINIRNIKYQKLDYTI